MKTNSNKGQLVTISILAAAAVVLIIGTNNNGQQQASGLLTNDQRYSLGAIDACDSLNFGYTSIDNPPTNSTIGNHHSKSYLDGYHAGFEICSTAYKRGYEPVESSLRHKIFQTDEGSNRFEIQINPYVEELSHPIQIPNDIIKNNYTITH